MIKFFRKFFGTIFFYCIFPILLLIGRYHWKKDSAFIIQNIYMYLKGGF
jgi:hypothetical protein